jgi:hypothetical protein
MKEMTREEYLAWKQDPKTKKVYQILREQRQILADSVARGDTLKGHVGTGEATARQVGIIYGVDLVLDFEVFEPPKEEK